MKLHDGHKDAEKVDPQNPMSIVRKLLEKSILATHKRPRKAVSSYSIVTFKDKKREPKREHAYPSNWGDFVLYCKTGWLLQVLPNGVVNGTTNVNAAYGKLAYVPNLSISYGLTVGSAKNLEYFSVTAHLHCNSFENVTSSNFEFVNHTSDRNHTVDIHEERLSLELFHVS